MTPLIGWPARIVGPITRLAVSITSRPLFRGFIPDADEAISVRVRQWLHDDAVDQAKDRGAGADAQGEGKNGDKGEARAPGESPYRVVHIGSEVVHQIALPGGAGGSAGGAVGSAAAAAHSVDAAQQCSELANPMVLTRHPAETRPIRLACRYGRQQVGTVLVSKVPRAEPQDEPVQRAEGSLTV
jgi:hypothetical protein